MATGNCTPWAWWQTSAGSTRHWAHEAGESIRLKAQVSSFDPSAQRNFPQRSAAHQLRVRHLPQTGLLNKLTLEGPNPTLVPSVWSIQHLYVSLSYMCTCTMCFCWVLKDYLSHGGFFCHVLFCYFRSPFKIKQATLPHISPREETKKAQQMLVIVQMLVCLMYFWKYSGTWAMSRVQTQNRTCGLKSTSFSAAP